MIYVLILLAIGYLIYSNINIRRNWYKIGKARSTLSLRFSSIFILSSLIPNIIVGSSALLMIKYQIGTIFNDDILNMVHDIELFSKEYVTKLTGHIKHNMHTCFNKVKTSYPINDLYQYNQEYQLYSSLIIKYTNQQIKYLLTSSKVDIDIPIDMMQDIDLQFIEQNNNIIGIGKIKNDIYYIMVARKDQSIDKINTNIETYMNLYRKSDLYIQFLLYILYVIVILMCIFSIIGGVIISNRLIAPFDSLILFSKRKKDNRWKKAYPELMLFIKKFKDMLLELNNQNDQLKARNEIIENIFSVAPMGIIVLEKNKIFMKNNIAESLLQNIDIENINISKSESFNINNKEIKVIRKENIILIEDITEFIEYRKNKLLSQAARQVAHEIKNPLTPIILAIDILKTDPHRYECLDIIYRNVKHIQSLVEAFRQFSSFPKCTMEYHNLSDIIRDLDKYNDIYKSKCKIYIPKIKDIYFTCDKLMIERVFLNLIKNAIEAGASKIRIEVKISERIEILFHDNGKGFDDLTNPAKLYYTTKANGTGLGLAIVEHTIMQHHGKVDYHNTLRYNHGASVKISFNAKDFNHR